MTISAGDLDERMAEVLKALGTLEDSAANYFLSIGSVQSLDDAKPVSRCRSPPLAIEHRRIMMCSPWLRTVAHTGTMTTAWLRAAWMSLERR